jgi:hypothetical protein
LQRFYQHKLVQKGLGKAKVAAARKLGIRLWILLRDQIDYQEFCLTLKLDPARFANGHPSSTFDRLVVRTTRRRAGLPLLKE